MQTRTPVLVAGILGICACAACSAADEAAPAGESEAPRVLTVDEMVLSVPIEDMVTGAPKDANPFGIEGEEGEGYYLTRSETGGVDLTVVISGAAFFMWHGGEGLQIAGRNGSELILAQGAGEATSQRELWSAATGFISVNVRAPGMGPYPSNLDPDLVQRAIALLSAEDF